MWNTGAIIGIYGCLSGHLQALMERCLATNSLIREELGNGIHFTAVMDSKFKENSLSINFQIPLRPETAELGALLPMVLRRGCRRYPDMVSLNEKLSGLYGAVIDGSVEKHGDTQIICLACSLLNQKYAFDGTQVLEECAGLLRDVAFDPVLNGKAFREADTAIERKNLADLIDAQVNDKHKYAVNRMKEEMFPGDPYGYSLYGRREKALAVSPEELYGFWVDTVATARIEILFIGAGNTDSVKQAFKDAFEGKRTGAVQDCGTTVSEQLPQKVREVDEKLDIVQSKLVMGFLTNCAVPQNTDAVTLANCILGGGVSSKLFLNVREKLSLCYYCYSAVDRIKGAMLISAGISQENYEKARDEILNQLEALRAGDFTKDEMDSAVLSLQNAFNSVNDSIEKLHSFYVSRAFSDDLRTPADVVSGITAVTKDQAVRAAENFKLDTVYLLHGGKDGE